MLVTYILTHNRPTELRSLVKNIFSSCGNLDNFLCVVVDDSTNAVCQNANKCLEVSEGNHYKIIYKRPDKMIAPKGVQGLKIFSGNKNEIGWLRNIILHYHRNNFSDFDCIMLDDDMNYIDINSIYREAQILSKEQSSFIAGLNIYGIDSRDTITRIESTLQDLSKNNKISKITNLNINQILFSNIKKNIEFTSRLSGGGLYLHGCLNIFPWFPNCYNESWIFCKISNLLGIPSIRMASSAQHDPFFIERKTIEEMVFEQKGVFLERILFYTIDKLALKKNKIIQLTNFEKISSEKHPNTRLKDLLLKINLIPSSVFDLVWKKYCKEEWMEFYLKYQNIDWHEELDSYYTNFIKN